MNPSQTSKDAIRADGASAGDGAPGPSPVSAPPATEQGGVHPAPVPAPPMSPRKKAIYGGLGLVAIAVVCYVGIPWIVRVWTTVSTDDAYVNGHVTFVAARVPGQVMQVLVDDNNRVKKGDLLVVLDVVPYEIQVKLKTAFFALAKADLLAAKNQVRGQLAQARSTRFKLEHEIENVNNQIALLRANVANVAAAKARAARALADYDRAKELAKTPGAISGQDLDLKLQDSRVADAQVKQALETVYQTRVSLGLPAQPEKGDDLTQVPPNLDQNFSTVRQTVGELFLSAAPLSVYPSSYDLTPKQILAEFYKRDPQGNVDHIYAQLLQDAPAIKQADAKLQQAEQDLEQAKLNLSYCEVRAEIDGVVTRRNVNRGNNVQAGQSLMAVRSLTEIWIDANFKETQLRDLRIGQRVELDVDMYGSRHTFEGRITGFTMGTGQTLSLLPPQNATGNFVKIVQRLPVRVELTDYNPDKDPPLFIGLSVEPTVFIKEAPKGPDAGKFLQPFLKN